MDLPQEYSLFLVRMLEELDVKHRTMSYQDLCKALCARLDLAHLSRLRSLLFHTACLDPAFPATLFKDKLRGSLEDPQSTKLMLAADVVAMFNLIQMNGGVTRDKLPPVHRPRIHKHQSVDAHSDCERGGAYADPRLHHQHPQHPSGPRPPERQQVFLGVSKDLKCRAASLDKLHHLPQYPSPPSPPCHVQISYFPMEVDPDSTTEQDSPQHLGPPDTRCTRPCSQRRNIFKEDFHNMPTFSPQIISLECKQGIRGNPRRELHKPATFFNHSFELPYSNPYFEPALNSPLQDRRRVKHESLDDLQASTYFGPTTVSECVSSRKHFNKAGKQSAWPMKSLSLNTDEGPLDFDRSLATSKPQENQHNVCIITSDNEQNFQSPKGKVAASPSSFAKKTNGTKTKDVSLMANGPVDKREAGKRFWDKAMKSPSFQVGDCSSSVGTQTEKKKKAKEYPVKYGERERHTFKRPEDESEMLSDDISDIFRFLDDMSVCDSLGIVQSSCYNSNGSLSQGTLKSDADSSPERNTVKLAKSKLDRLFHSLENSDDELKSSVCKLVMRIGEIEKKLESLSGVRSEISQVLCKLNKLDEKIQEPDANGRHGETTLASGSSDTPEKPLPLSHTDSTLSPHVFQCHTTGHKAKMDSGSLGEWYYSDGSNSNSLRVKALKKSMFIRRSSHSLNEEIGADESKVTAITNSPRDWRTVSYSCHPGEDSKDQDRDIKDRHKKSKEAERLYELPQALRTPKPSKETYLMEQVFSPHPFTPSFKAHVKDSPLYTDLRISKVPDTKRSQPSWTIEEYKRNSGEKGKPLSALDLQTAESLNPDNLDYWMEDVYTPGYNSLLKRKEAEFRRAKACKISALIAAAACTVILVIVVPICTMRTG
ncbi:LOW QUALITY PROTEIN: major intrinsically disordered Notch2-binding receptor 1 [Thalassophryne amazonica]|uniref:LOW QUALITY PROTEIN: major intrinsically disordered Notch2-binding receptor 1 n=1 Tax=Thalassophryne amazonica TaxID=390379 RepID=UPI001471E31F|nr:LOW QUALITY PROTEIN: major intrinsically disordered Notch2-binding receptor 1 [Thalassophryne amazonica]